ncbi:hypothetical protein [Emticicia sp. W12TSBA100-4]|uniref:hypothetical protein n=1 Tax=Emticicia sp. W12TSBA100-4 TaxID=3160965 RepID=UPI00330673C0
MKKVFDFTRNNANVVWGVVAVLIFAFLFIMGRKAGIAKAQQTKKIVPYPDGGKSLGDWPKGSNTAGKTVDEIATEWAKKVLDVTDGVWITSPIPQNDRRLNVFISLSALSNDQLTAVYNKYNLNHGNKFWGFTFVSMTEVIYNEVLAYGSDVQAKLVNRLKSLKLK